MNLNWLPPFLALLLAPLLLGVINRTKAFFAGRSGSTAAAVVLRPCPAPAQGRGLQLDDFLGFPRRPDHWRSPPCSPRFSWSRCGGQPSLLHFSGDMFCFAALLALGRFATIIAALDTGSSFEGMGASREAFFGALAEPALYLSLAALVRHTGSGELSASLAALSERTG